MNDYAIPFRAGLVAALLSGAPSTVLTLAEGGNLLASTRAAATLVPGGGRSVAAGAAAHLTISLGWAVVLGRVLPRRRPVLEGLVAGAAIAALDLGLVARRFPAIRALPQGRQWLDHLAYGVLVSLLLARSGRTRIGVRRGGWPISGATS